MTGRSLILKTSNWETMRQHVEAETPLEACGLLAGREGIVETVLPVENAAGSSVRFRMEPRAQLKALDQIEAAGQELLAIFHSHPTGPPIPSPTDLKEAAYPVVYIIWSPAGDTWQARGFWLEDGRTTEVPLILQGV